MRVRSGSAAQWFGGIGVVLVAFLGAPTARASEGKTTKGGSSSPSSAATPGGTPAEGGRPPGAEGGRSDQADESEDDAEPIRIGLDFVAGTGKTSIANTAQPTQLEGMPANTIGSSQVTTESFIAAAGLEVHHFEFGLRMPLTIGHINLADIPSRRTTAFGNLELEGAYLHELRPGLSLVYALGVTLPTAQGQAVPSSASGLSSNNSGVLDLQLVRLRRHQPGGGVHPWVGRKRPLRTSTRRHYRGRAPLRDSRAPPSALREARQPHRHGADTPTTHTSASWSSAGASPTASSRTSSRACACGPTSTASSLASRATSPSASSSPRSASRSITSKASWAASCRSRVH